MPVGVEKAERLGGAHAEKRTVMKPDRRWRSFSVSNGKHAVDTRSSQHAKEEENGHASVSESGKEWGGALGGAREVANTFLFGLIFCGCICSVGTLDCEGAKLQMPRGSNQLLFPLLVCPATAESQGKHRALGRLRGGADMRDKDGISERFGGIWGGPVLWRQGHYDPKEDRETGWELGSECHGVCVPWCDRKDEALTRAAEEEDRASFAGESLDSDDENALLEPAASARFPLVGDFGKLFEAFEEAAAKHPAAVQSSFAILRANLDDPFESELVYASPLFVQVTKAPSLAHVLGRPWRDFYAHVDAEKKAHFVSIVKNVGEACESRFVLRQGWWDAAARVSAGAQRH